MVSSSLLWLPLVGCSAGERALSGKCPTGEVCSAETPDGLHFFGKTLSDRTLDFGGPHTTAIGGTREVELQSGSKPFALPYRADDDGGLGVRVESTRGPVITLRGVDNRKNYLRIVEPDRGALYDRIELAGAAIESIALVARPPP